MRLYCAPTPPLITGQKVCTGASRVGHGCDDDLGTGVCASHSLGECQDLCAAVLDEDFESASFLAAQDGRASTGRRAGPGQDDRGAVRSGGSAVEGFLWRSCGGCLGPCGIEAG